MWDPELGHQPHQKCHAILDCFAGVIATICAQNFRSICKRSWEKREIKWTLKTSDYREASKKFKLESAKADAYFQGERDRCAIHAHGGQVRSSPLVPILTAPFRMKPSAPTGLRLMKSMNRLQEAGSDGPFSAIKPLARLELLSDFPWKGCS